MNLAFHEVQKFNQWFIWLTIFGTGLVFGYCFYPQIILQMPFGCRPMSNSVLIITSILYLLFILCFYSLRLETTVNKQGINFLFFPFVKKDLPWHDIGKVEVLNYGFVGGWGIRIGTNYGTVYNIRGNKGVAIVLKSGKKLLIGTQKIDELKEVIKTTEPQRPN